MRFGETRDFHTSASTTAQTQQTPAGHFQACRGKPYVPHSCPVTPVANPKGVGFGEVGGVVWCGGGGGVCGGDSCLRLELRAVERLHTHTRTHTYRKSLPCFVPDVTCSLTKFWPLHHSFKIAKTARRNYILRTVTSAAGQVDAVASICCLFSSLMFFFSLNHKSHIFRVRNERVINA